MKTVIYESCVKKKASWCRPGTVITDQKNKQFEKFEFTSNTNA